MSTLTPTIERAESGSLVVTSETIAEGAGVEHRAVLQLIGKRSFELEQFGPVAFEMRQGSALPQGGFGASTRVALLNEQQATLLMSFQKNTDQVIAFKVALVKGFFEMARQLQAPAAPAELSRMELLQIAMQAEQERQALNAELETARPKAEYVDTFVADNDNHLFRAVASNLNIGEQDLRNTLLWCGWIYLQESQRRNSKGEITPTRQWAEFEHKKAYFHRHMQHQAPLFKGNVAFTLKLTTPGVSAVARLVRKIEDKHGPLKGALPALKESYEARHKGIATSAN